MKKTTFSELNQALTAAMILKEEQDSAKPRAHAETNDMNCLYGISDSPE
jgi:hypothetical protein